MIITKRNKTHFPPFSLSPVSNPTTEWILNEHLKSVIKTYTGKPLDKF